MSRKIAISDIHGCYDTFLALLEQVKFTPKDKLYLLGDFIDRGPKSKQVLDWIIDKEQEGYHLRFIRGNHEQMMLNARNNDNKLRVWFRNGGEQVLESFQVKSVKQIPQKYWDFLEDLKFFHATKKYLFVHAGLNFGNEDPLQDKEAIIWTRYWYDQIDYDWLGKRILLHGHTPIPKEAIQEMLDELPEKQVINIDAGCYGRDVAEGFGYLCALDLTNRQLYSQFNIDKMNWNAPM